MLKEITEIEIGIFAHNEEKDIPALLHDLSHQSILVNKDRNVRVTILANNCSDSTIGVSDATIAEMKVDAARCFQVLDLKEGGKSRTWNSFVHSTLKTKTQAVFFLDADIRITKTLLLDEMVTELSMRSELNVLTSRPMKSELERDVELNIVQKLIASAGGTSTNYKKSICGQCYLTRARVLAPVYMPIGLPVEDGFVRAMLLTDLLVNDENLDSIDGDEKFFHFYDSVSSIGELIKHQTRIVIGSAINSAIFEFLREGEDDLQRRTALLKVSSQDEEWLKRLVRQRLPKFPYGFVPFGFLTKRLENMFSQSKAVTLKKVTVAFLGFSFDFIVYCNATIKMALGKGAGHW